MCVTEAWARPLLRYVHETHAVSNAQCCFLNLTLLAYNSIVVPHKMKRPPRSTVCIVAQNVVHNLTALPMNELT